jgi:hypothetical protein
MEFENLDAQFVEIMKQLTPPLRVERPVPEPSLGQYLELKRDLHGGSGGSRGGGSACGGGGGRSGSGSGGGRDGSGGSGARCGCSGDGSSGGSSGDHGGEGGAGACGGGGAGGSCVPVHAQSIATTLYNEAAALVPRMQSTTDPATLRKLACKRPPPSVALAAAGLGLHRGAYREASRAMADLNRAYPNSIPASIQKNPGIIALVKGWRQRFARYDELLAREMLATTTTTTTSITTTTTTTTTAALTSACHSPGSPVPRSPAQKEKPARRARGRGVTALALPVGEI